MLLTHSLSTHMCVCREGIVPLWRWSFYHFSSLPELPIICKTLSQTLSQGVTATSGAAENALLEVLVPLLNLHRQDEDPGLTQDNSFWPDRHSDYFYLNLSLSLQFWISSSPQPAKADERPLESGSALGFFLQGSFSMLLSHLAWHGGFSCFVLIVENAL